MSETSSSRADGRENAIHVLVAKTRSLGSPEVINYVALSREDVSIECCLIHSIDVQLLYSADVSKD